MPATTQYSASLKAITARQLQALVRRQPVQSYLKKRLQHCAHAGTAGRRPARRLGHTMSVSWLQSPRTTGIGHASRDSVSSNVSSDACAAESWGVGATVT